MTKLLVVMVSNVSLGVASRHARVSVALASSTSLIQKLGGTAFPSALVYHVEAVAFPALFQTRMASARVILFPMAYAPVLRSRQQANKAVSAKIRHIQNTILIAFQRKERSQWIFREKTL